MRISDHQKRITGAQRAATSSDAVEIHADGVPRTPLKRQTAIPVVLLVRQDLCLAQIRQDWEDGDPLRIECVFPGGQSPTGLEVAMSDGPLQRGPDTER